MPSDQPKSVPGLRPARPGGDDRPVFSYVAAFEITLFLSWLLAFKLGGAGRVEPHWLYIPIMICAYRFGRLLTLVASAAAGILMGPLTPDHFVHGVWLPQVSSEWLSRAAAFVVIGQVMAVVFHKLRRERDLARASLRDPLTGLANRVLFLDRLELGLARIHRNGGVLGVLFLDLDDFKAVNDRRGHGVGDDLLISISERLRQAVRAEDTLARLSGDEFAVMVEGGNPPEIALVAERLLDAMDEPFFIGDQMDAVHVSIGVAHTSDGTISPTQLLRNADTAMYEAKRAGKNRYDVFPPRTVELRDLYSKPVLDAPSTMTAVPEM